MKNIFTVSVLIMLVIGFSSEAKLYKWVDEDGKVSYSDKMPPDQIKNAHQTLSEHGVVKEQIERDLTDEEKIEQASEMKQQRLLAAEKVREAERLEAERNTIMMSYSSADQITRLKEERISALERNIQTAQDNLIIQKKNQKDLMSRAADKERSGEVVSDVFMSQINQIKEQIEYQEQFIIDKSAEIVSTRTKYDRDMVKFLEYTGQNNIDAQAGNQ